MLLNFFIIGVGLFGLYLGGTLFVSSASALARRLGMSSLMVGLTVVAVGTSLPELIVSMGAALTGLSEIALGNVVGSNIANIGLILGLSGMIMPLSIHVSSLRRELPVMIAVTLLTLGLALNGALSRLDGLILLGGMVIFVVWTIYGARQSDGDGGEIDHTTDEALWRILLRMVGGLGLLLIAARLTVDGATAMARDFGVSDLVIGMTLVAVGTSLPELVTSVTAALQKESDIAIGNVVGSNIFNLLGILGVTALASPIPIAPQVLQVDGVVMLGFAVLLFIFLFNRRLDKLESLALLGLYIGYNIFLFGGR